jgi:hypothetical protein
LLDRIEGNGIRTVIVEDASRFARDLMTQELGILALINRGVRVLTGNGDDLTDSSDPSRVMMRQIAGAFHQYEKARLVAKLKAARQRKRETTGRSRAARAGRNSIPPSWPRLSACGAGRRRAISGRCAKSLPSWRSGAMSTNAGGILSVVGGVDHRKLTANATWRIRCRQFPLRRLVW